MGSHRELRWGIVCYIPQLHDDAVHAKWSYPDAPVVVVVVAFVAAADRPDDERGRVISQGGDGQTAGFNPPPLL
jgi:hypothetical protein